jgi:diguanylate cyclase (GGDEF)-like protein
VNDRYGHPAGDATLRAVAHVLQRVLGQTRESDQPLAARYGGEELAVLLPATGPAGARRIADAIREAVERTTIRDQGQEIRVTLSGGVASFPANGRTARCLLTAADAALYAAKRGGRNRIETPATEPTSGPLLDAETA